MRIPSLAALALCFGCAGPVFGQSEVSDPDRPDVTNGTHIVAPGLVQIEFGALYSHDAPDQGTANSPFTVRIGVTDWFEARVGADGVLTQTTADSRTTEFGNVQLERSCGCGPIPVALRSFRSFRQSTCRRRIRATHLCRATSTTPSLY